MKARAADCRHSIARSAKNFVGVHNKFMVCIQNNQKFHKLYYALNICIIGNDNDDNDDDDDDCGDVADDMQSYRYMAWHGTNVNFAVCK